MDYSQLFDTVDTVTPGTGSGVFTTEHFMVLTFMLMLIVFIAYTFKRSAPERRAKILTGVMLFVLLNEILKDVYLAWLGQITWAHMPLHMCGINVLMITAYWFLRKEKIAEWLYAMSISGGMVALLSPDWGKLPVMNIMFWQANTIHAGLVLFPVLLLIDGFRPSGKRFLKVVPYMLLLAAIIYPINKILDTNFFFLNWAPLETPFEMFEVKLGNPGYLAGFALVCTAVWSLMYLPWCKKEATAKETV